MGGGGGEAVNETKKHFACQSIGQLFKFLCLDSHSHASATSETIKNCRI